MDVQAIAAAIATRYAPANVVPPAGLDNVRRSSAKLPQALGAMPHVLVFPEQGVLEPGNGSRVGAHEFLVRFYLQRVRDRARETHACQRWLTVLLDQHKTNLQLGGLVDAVRTVGWRIGVLEYAGSSYSGIELRIQVVTTEAWAATA